MSYLFIAFILALFIGFVSVAIALLIGKSLGNVAGFSIVGSVYLMIGLILWFSRVKLISKLETTFSHMFRKKK